MIPIRDNPKLCTSVEKRHVGTSMSRLELHNLQNFEIVQFLSARENIDFPELYACAKARTPFGEHFCMVSGSPRKKTTCEGGSTR